MAKLRGKGGGGHIQLPHSIMDSKNYHALSYSARALLNVLIRQHNGFNNGNLSAAWTRLKEEPYRWRSRTVLYTAVDELLRAGMIEETRVGGRSSNRICSLFALTWLKIEPCKAKGIEGTSHSSGKWHQPMPVVENRPTKRKQRSRPCAKDSDSKSSIPTNYPVMEVA